MMFCGSPDGDGVDDEADDDDGYDGDYGYDGDDENNEYADFLEYVKNPTPQA